MKLSAAGAMALLLLASPSHAEEVQHGSGQHDHDSRGAGDGDGQGEPDKGGHHEPDDGDAEPEPFGIEVGDGALIVPSMQYRFRYYHDDGRDFQPGGAHNYVRHRARLGIKGSYKKWIHAFLQFQDVRTWGEEGHPVGDFSADGLDLHQAYLQIGRAGKTQLTVGRQVLSYMNQRIVGGLEWSEQGRAFDAIRLALRRDGAVFDAAWALERAVDDRSGDASESEEPTFGKRHLGVWHIGHDLARAFKPHVLVVYQGDTRTDLGRVTAGSMLEGRWGKPVWFGYELEAYFQYGKENPDITYVANMFSAKATIGADYDSKPYVELWSTFSSGDDDPTDTTVRTFQRPHPTAHKFHGEMDMMLNLLRDTGERGLRDFGTALGIAPGGTHARLAFHVLDANKDRGDNRFRFGWETDVSLKGRYLDDHLGFELVFGVFMPGDLAAPGLPEPETEQLAYITLDAKF